MAIKIIDINELESYKKICSVMDTLVQFTLGISDEHAKSLNSRLQ